MQAIIDGAREALVGLRYVLDPCSRLPAVHIVRDPIHEGRVPRILVYLSGGALTRTYLVLVYLYS